MSLPQLGPCPSHLVDLKHEIATSYPDFELRVTKAWNEVLDELKVVTTNIIQDGSSYIPQINFSDLQNMTEEHIRRIRQTGCVVIRGVVDAEQAITWKTELQEYVRTNPVNGFPEEDKQFFQLYWSKAQVQARSHPNILAVSTWLNNLYHVRSDGGAMGIDPSRPLTYADRFRMRHPGNQWFLHPPHIDGGGIERWEDRAFRACFTHILSGDWKKHDPYDLVARVRAKDSLEHRENLSTVLRAFQGWLALSDTAPSEGTLQVFPDVALSNAYLILRPFFKPATADAADRLDPKNWKYDVSDSDFPGIYSMGPALIGPKLDPSTHPHLRLEQAMVSVPKVQPGDMVFWHGDVIHAVERQHTGKEDSCVMYIPAVPYTQANAAYIMKQKDSFIQGNSPPDYPTSEGEREFVRVGKLDDIMSEAGRMAMGFAVDVDA